jgi:hypothetical protein
LLPVPRKYCTELNHRESIKLVLSANECLLWVRSGHGGALAYVRFGPIADIGSIDYGRARAAGSLPTKHVIFVFLIMRLWFESHFSGSRLAALQSRLRCVTKVKDGFG